MTRQNREAIAILLAVAVVAAIVGCAGGAVIAWLSGH